ncbi:MAG TPA: hypothetical protein VKI61_15030 [Chitinophagaceae bacterium]|jgi:hypothetical protein|nr:hypothetical protein [Chitinophagaceae bacterium]
MKTPSTSLFNTISKVQLISLTTEVKETLAMDAETSLSKKITAADVWNIQRNKRARVQRRFAL